MTPRYTIIIPVYNIERYLRPCLESVLGQVCTNWECICVDDGSTDSSLSILDNYAALDSRFRVIHQNNGGVSSARNKGIQEAMGEYTVFVDGDDIIHPNLIRDLDDGVSFASHADIISSKSFKFEDGEVFEWPSRVSDKVCCDDIALECTERASLINICGVAFLTRKAKNMSFRSLSMGEDMIFVAEMLACSSRIVYVPQIDYAYRQRNGSATHSVVSLKRTRDALSAYIPYFSAILRQKRKLPRIVTNTRGYGWLKNTVIMLNDLHDKDDRHALCWNLFFENCAYATTHGYLDFSASIAVRLLTFTRSRSLAFVLMVMPMRVKRAFNMLRL